MKVVILGASGQIGSVIYQGLGKLYAVTGTSRNNSDKYIQFDPFRDDWSILGKVDVLINCVGQIDATPESSFHHIHVGMTEQILRHRKLIGSPRIVQLSALGASLNHKVEFLRTKGIADHILLQQLNTAVIRPSIVCTHRTMIILKMILLSNIGRFLFGFIPVPNGFLQTRIQPIMPQDLVELVQRLCVDSEVTMVNAVGPKAITFRELVQMLSKSRNQTLRMIEVSRTVVDVVVKSLINPLLPGLINEQQYELIFQDNTGNVEVCEKLLGRRLNPTEKFFENEFA